MSIMTGQGDLLELLTSPTRDEQITCPACGETSRTAWAAHNDHTIMPLPTRAAGFPVCVGMNLTYNHVLYSLGQLAAKTPDPMYRNGRNIKRPTREHLTEELHLHITRAKTKWRQHPDFLDSELLGAALIKGVPTSLLNPESESQ